MDWCCQNECPNYPAKVRTKVGEFERIITFAPSYRCNKTGGNSHGHHGVNMLWVLAGSKGAITFLVYTGWGTSQELMGAGLDYHAYAAQYSGQTVTSQDCIWIKGPCYNDGSVLMSRDVFQLLIEQGEEAVWQFMESKYHLWLGEPCP